MAYTVGLIGAGIGRSLSPALHEREAHELGLECEYRLLELDEPGREPEAVGALVREARDRGWAGVNVTHPCKQLVVGELDELSSEAEAIDAVNTVVFDGDRLAGHNTDATGFREAFERGLPGVATDRVAVVGAGGAGAAVAHAALRMGAGEVTITDVDQDRAEELADRLGARAAELRPALERADGLIHATPTGMTAYPGSAIPRELLRPEMWVSEVVYMPVETQLVRDARERGCRTLTGAGMVALQAAGSMELFAGVRPDRERMLRHVEDLIASAFATR